MAKHGRIFPFLTASWNWPDYWCWCEEWFATREALDTHVFVETFNWRPFCA